MSTIQATWENLHKPRMGLVWWLTVLAGLQSLTGATVIVEVLPTTVSGGFVAVIGALNQGTAVYVALTTRNRKGKDNSGQNL